MDLTCENVFKVVVYVVAAYVALRIIQDNCDIGLGGFFKSVEGFVDGDVMKPKEPVGKIPKSKVAASEKLGSNEVQDLLKTI